MTRIILMAAGMAGFVLFAVWPLTHIWLYGHNDFLSFYAGAKLAFTAHLYDPAAVAQLQVESSGASGAALRFIRLPGYAMALSPLSLLTYLPAYAVWQLINLAAVIGALCLWPFRRDLFASVLAVWLPAYWSFAAGQDVPLVLLGITAGLRLLQSERPVSAGIAFGLCLVKFHFFWLVPLALLAQRRYRTVAGVMLAACLFVLPGFLVNPAWPLDYYATVLAGRSVISKSSFLFPALGWAGMLAAALITLAAGFRLSAGLAVSLAAAAAVLVAPHAYLADLTLLVPLLALLWQRASEYVVHRRTAAGNNAVSGQAVLTYTTRS